jgi:hypothetical protein
LNVDVSFLPLLEAEFRETQRIFNERLKEWTVHKLVREGYAVVGLVGSLARYRAKGGAIILEFRRSIDASLPYHRFR